jgi:ABC-2 type transport system ATP-binding protein
VLPYANWLDGGAKGLQTFTVKITEVTRSAQYVEDLPLIGGFAASALDLLRTMPEASVQMAPTAGATTTAKISVRVDQLAPEGTPVAFTYRVPSFDGTLISTNFFPASGLAAEASAALALNGAGLGQPGSSDPNQVHGSDPYVPGVGTLRNAGYNVITWDPRGEFASGGILQLDNPFFEGRDVSALLDWAAALPEVQLNAPNDPVVGMVGGSYGGGIQLITASMDPRIDAIVPELAWNSLNESLSPNGILNKQAASSLLASITSPSIRVNTLIRQGLKDSISRGKLSDTTRTLLTSNDMDPLLRQLQAPTLLVQSVVDALFPLNASIQNAQAIRANPYGTPVKMMWIDPANDDAEVAGGNVRALSILWLDKYIRGIPIPDAAIPAFQWWDQSGNRQTSTLLPFEPGFNQATPISATSTGGSLTFTSAKKPSTISLSAQVAAGAQIAGSPTMSFTYLGKGTARAVYVQVADASTKKVLGNVVTPIPVTLDGKQRTVSIPLGDLVYTANGASSLSITIMSSSSAFASSGTGRIAISNISVSIPKRSP